VRARAAWAAIGLLALFSIGGAGSEHAVAKDQVARLIGAVVDINGEIRCGAWRLPEKFENHSSLMVIAFRNESINDTTNNSRYNSVMLRVHLAKWPKITFNKIERHRQLYDVTREDRKLQLLAVTGGRWPLLRAHILLSGEQVASLRKTDNLQFDEDVSGRCFAGIFQIDSQFRHCPIGCDQAKRIGDDWLIRERNPRSLIGLHNIQLPSHGGQLTQENPAGYDAYRYEGTGEYSHAPSPSRHYQIAIGLLLLAATYAAVLIAFKGAEYADYRWPALWWLPLLGGLVLAGWLAVHTLNYLAG